MSREFVYTDRFSESENFTSSSVYQLSHNANDNTLAVEWQENEDIYVYSGVTADEVRTCVNSYSVGSAVNLLKQIHGPGQNLGWDVDFEPVGVESPDIETKEFSLQIGNVTVDSSAGVGISAPADGVTHEFSLDSEPADAPEPGLVTENEPTFIVHYTVNETEHRTDVQNVSTYQEAITHLETAAETLGLRFVVKKVVIGFE